MTMTLPELILLIVIAAICGAIGRALAGGPRGGLHRLHRGRLRPGPSWGPWIAARMKLPEPFMVHISGHSFPVSLVDHRGRPVRGDHPPDFPAAVGCERVTTRRWRELWDAYPRIVSGTALVVAAFPPDGPRHRLQAGAVRPRAGAHARRHDGDRAPASGRHRGLEESRLALAVELARRQAWATRICICRWIPRMGFCGLERQGARLREMRVRLGQEDDRGHSP